MVTLEDGHTPKDGMFMAQEHLEGRNFEIEFHWIPLEEVKNIELYPVNARVLLERLEKGVQHFVYYQEQ